MFLPWYPRALCVYVIRVTGQREKSSASRVSPMRVRIRASELAAVAGKHPYKKQADAMREVMARCVHGKRKAEEVKAEALLKNVSVESKVKTAKTLGVDVTQIENATKHAKTEAEKEEKIKDLLPSFNVTVVKAVDKHSLDVAKKVLPANESLPKEVAPLVQQHMRMAVGTVEETSILNMAQERFPEDVGENAVMGEWPDFFSIGRTDSGIEVELTGMCDAIDRSRETVFEIKRRKAHLFHTVPEYERIQLEAYLRLYKCSDGALIEYHPIEGMKIHWVEKDDSLWEDVKVAVLKAIENH